MNPTNNNSPRSVLLTIPQEPPAPPCQSQPSLPSLMASTSLTGITRSVLRTVDATTRPAKKISFHASVIDSAGQRGTRNMPRLSDAADRSGERDFDNTPALDFLRQPTQEEQAEKSFSGDVYGGESSVSLTSQTEPRLVNPFTNPEKCLLERDDTCVHVVYKPTKLRVLTPEGTVAYQVLKQPVTVAQRVEDSEQMSLKRFQDKLHKYLGALDFVLSEAKKEDASL